MDVDAAVAELREIAGGRADLLGEVAGRTLGFGGDAGVAMWPRKALEAALLMIAGAGPDTARRMAGPRGALRQAGYRARRSAQRPPLLLSPLGWRSMQAGPQSMMGPLVRQTAGSV